MQMAAAGWSRVQERKVFASMRKQRRIPISSNERGGREQRTNIIASSPLHDRVATNELCSRRFQILSVADVERSLSGRVSEVPCLMTRSPVS